MAFTFVLSILVLCVFNVHTEQSFDTFSEVLEKQLQDDEDIKESITQGIKLAIVEGIKKYFRKPLMGNQESKMAAGVVLKHTLKNDIDYDVALNLIPTFNTEDPINQLSNIVEALMLKHDKPSITDEDSNKFDEAKVIFRDFIVSPELLEHILQFQVLLPHENHLAEDALIDPTVMPAIHKDKLFNNGERIADENDYFDEADDEDGKSNTDGLAETDEGHVTSEKPVSLDNVDDLQTEATSIEETVSSFSEEYDGSQEDLKILIQGHQQASGEVVQAVEALLKDTHNDAFHPNESASPQSNGDKNTPVMKKNPLFNRDYNSDDDISSNEGEDSHEEEHVTNATFTSDVIKSSVTSLNPVPQLKPTQLKNVTDSKIGKINGGLQNDDHSSEEIEIAPPMILIITTTSNPPSLFSNKKLDLRASPFNPPERSPSSGGAGDENDDDDYSYDNYNEDDSDEVKNENHKKL